RHVRFGHEVRGAAWDDDARRWRVETTRGTTFVAPVLVLASGALSDAVIPPLPGLDTFRGAAFHSAHWNHDFDLTGRRVAVVGTGASAIQFVPAIQPKVAALHLFQRTAPWIMPRHDRPLRARALLRRVPLARRALRAAIYARREAFVLAFRSTRVAHVAERVALRHLRRQVPDATLRAKLTPRFTMGCKRVLLSDDYYPAVSQPNVELVTSGIAEVRERSIVGADGVERPVDAIVFGTGFRPTSPPLAPHVRGRGGRTLEEAWRGSPRAHLGVTVAGFPNLFMLMGPNTGLGHSSVVYMIETQIEHMLGALRWMSREGVSAIEPRPEAQARFVADVERRMKGTVWVAGHCASWYLDATGRNSTLWPDFTWRYRRRAARMNPADYVAHRAAPTTTMTSSPRPAPAVVA
ncbi:MAG TPA: NAD(P)/FAD-dependent oxidoreductase, partial [Gemmatimonadaceae bacterium]|nr:NAD(P)/FAD-dependent oxidoreductase [Gemmatimonadaceae bacterium]